MNTQLKKTKTKQLIATLQLSMVQSEEAGVLERLPIGGIKRLLPYRKISCMGFLRNGKRTVFLCNVAFLISHDRLQRCKSRIVSQKEKIVIMTALIRTGKERYNMRLNGKMLMEIMGTKNLTEEMVCSSTGLNPRALQGILKDGFASDDAAERVAEVIGVSVGEILLPEVSGNVENVIEFMKDSGRATVSFSQGRYKSRIKKLAAERPEECEIVAENKDGSLCAHIPVAWIKIKPTQQITEEQREVMAERMRRNIAKHDDSRRENV